MSKQCGYCIGYWKCKLSVYCVMRHEGVSGYVLPSEGYQEREILFNTNAHCRFHIPQKREKYKFTCGWYSSIRSNRTTGSLDQSFQNPQLNMRDGLQQECTSMLSSSFEKELFLDFPDEVALAINKMKLKKPLISPLNTFVSAEILLSLGWLSFKSCNRYHYHSSQVLPSPSTKVQRPPGFEHL